MGIQEISFQQQVKEGYLRSYYIKDNIEILLSQIRKNTSLDLHQHQHLQFGYCFEGSFIFIAGDEEYTIHTADAYLLEANIPHKSCMMEHIYSIDFKYNIPYALKDKIILNVFMESFKQNDLTITPSQVASAKLFKIEGIGKLELLDFKANLKSEIYLMAAKKVDVLYNSIQFSIVPMKIYKVESVSSLEITQNAREMFLISV